MVQIIKSISYLDNIHVNITGDTMTGPLTLENIIFNGGTGTNTFDIPDNLADALSITAGGSDRMIFDTTDGAEQITIPANKLNTWDFQILATDDAQTGLLFYAGDEGFIRYIAAGQTVVGAGNPKFFLEIGGLASQDSPLLSLYNDIDTFSIFYEGHVTGPQAADAWLIQANETIRFESLSGVLQFKGKIQIGEVQNKVGAGDPIIEWFHDGTDGFITASSGNILISQIVFPDTVGIFGDSTTELDVRRTISNLDNTNVTGSGTIQIGGDGSFATDLTYRVEITTGGSVGTAKYRWSDDNGNTWNVENLTTAISPLNMNNGLKVWFKTGTFNANDYATVTAIGTNNQNKTLIVDTTNNKTLLGGSLNMQNNAITNFAQLAMKGAVEATISSGAITITEGHIKIDTEADAANDDLDTINSTQSGEILFLLPADDTRTVRIRHGVGNIFLKHQVESKSFSFASPSGSSGTFYAGGYYNWADADANLTQALLSVTHSAANSASACHIGIVAAGAGTVDTGVVKLTISGTTIDDNGVRNASQTVTLVADITTLATDQYIETVEKWIGQVTIALATASGSPVNFNLDLNYGCSKYEDFGNQAFTVNVLECVGRAGANDTGFNLRLFHHSTTGWTYAATGFVPGGTVLANMNTDYSTEQDLANGESFAYKRVNLNTDISGDNGEGVILEITTSANKAVEVMDIHFGVHTAPNFAYMATTKQHLIFMKHGGNWLEL